MLFATKNISIDEKEISEVFVRSSGPGGQNVNKVSTAVELRFNIYRSASLPGHVKHRLAGICSNRINSEGDLIITSSTERTQLQNRSEAIRKLLELIRAASIVPKTRRKTKPTRASHRKRLEGKKSKSSIKRNRGRPQHGSDE